MFEITPYLAVRGGAAALEWYAHVFEASQPYDAIFTADGVMVHGELRREGYRVMLSEAMPELGRPWPERDRGCPVTMFMEVDDTDALVARAVAAGAEIIREPSYEPELRMRIATILDPFGHRWFFSQQQ